MIKIAIVEDDFECANLLVDYISAYEKESGLQFSVTVFKDGLSFISDYKPFFDLVFMDIKMPNLNGMETAKVLYGLDKNICIIFVTTIVQYAVKGYEVDALDFIVKPVSYYNFVKKLEKAIVKIHSRAEKDILVSTENEVVRLSITNIDYIDIDKHYINIHVGTEIYKERGTMKEMEEKLMPEGFSRSNNGCLVNLRKVKKINKTTVQLQNCVLPISRQRRKDFIDDFMTYMRGK